MAPTERNKFQGIGRRILFVALLVGLTAGFVFGRKGLLQWENLRQRAREMEIQNDSLQREILALSAHIQALQAADSLELERAARHWHMARPGEEVYIVKDNKPDSAKDKTKTPMANR